jgi:hypothetical protein
MQPTAAKPKTTSREKDNKKGGGYLTAPPLCLIVRRLGLCRRSLSPLRRFKFAPLPRLPFGKLAPPRNQRARGNFNPKRRISMSENTNTEKTTATQYKITKTLTLAEQSALIDHVVEVAFAKDESTPSRLFGEVAFITAFAKLCTDIPEKYGLNSDSVDVQEIYDAVVASGLLGDLLDYSVDIDGIAYTGRLWELANRQVDMEFKSRLARERAVSADALETFAVVMDKLITLIDAGIEQVNKNGDKLFKNLSPKKFDALIGKLQSAVAEALTGKPVSES